MVSNTNQSGWQQASGDNYDSQDISSNVGPVRADNRWEGFNFLTVF